MKVFRSGHWGAFSTEPRSYRFEAKAREAPLSTKADWMKMYWDFITAVIGRMGNIKLESSRAPFFRFLLPFKSLALDCLYGAFKALFSQASPSILHSSREAALLIVSMLLTILLLWHSPGAESFWGKAMRGPVYDRPNCNKMINLSGKYTDRWYLLRIKKFVPLFRRQQESLQLTAPHSRAGP